MRIGKLAMVHDKGVSNMQLSLDVKISSLNLRPSHHRVQRGISCLTQGLRISKCVSQEVGHLENLRSLWIVWLSNLTQLKMNYHMKYNIGLATLWFNCFGNIGHISLTSHSLWAEHIGLFLLITLTTNTTDNTSHLRDLKQLASSGITYASMVLNAFVQFCESNIAYSWRGCWSGISSSDLLKVYLTRPYLDNIR